MYMEAHRLGDVLVFTYLENISVFKDEHMLGLQACLAASTEISLALRQLPENRSCFIVL